MKVAIAEASRGVRSFLIASLRGSRAEGAAVVEIQSGGELIRFLKSESGEGTLILLDWNLPGVDVPTLLGYLRERRGLDRIALVLCVEPYQRRAAQDAVRQGARGFVMRPFCGPELHNQINQAVREFPADLAASGSSLVRDMATTMRAKENLPTLLSLPSALIGELFERAPRRRYEAGESILSPEERVDSLRFVTAGLVEILGDPGPGACQLRGSGECFAERAFICGEPSRVAVRARSAVEVAAVSKETVVELSRRHAALRDYLTVLLTRRSVPSTEGVSEFAGSLTSLPFSDLLQFLNSTRKTGVLVLHEGSRQGRIYVEGGEVTHAIAEGALGDAAFFTMAGWAGAQFDFLAGALPEARTIYQSTMRLLMSSYLGSRDADSPAPGGAAPLCAQVG